ncbi:hypothetical protein H1R20_g11996, partial [Candolleomyces eurysporus]
MTVLQEDSEPRLVEHHHLGLNTTFRGIEHSLSTSDAPFHQFRGIKYASIPARFRQSKLQTDYPPVTDATQHGPICPQPDGRRLVEELLFGVPEDRIPKQTLKQDEFECLNLNITCPAGLTQSSRLPVMIWVHGGADRGSGSHWMYDAGPLVRKSVELDTPIILVTFNFRIGLLGFAGNNMIREDNKAAGDEGTGNYGLRDQQRCFEWVSQNILGFGGDPDNVTLFGASSGAADIICHLFSKANALNPIFARAIVQSPVFEPTLPDVSAAGWQLSRVMSTLQASDMKSLRALKVEKLLGLGAHIRHIDDGVFFREGWMNHFQHKGSARSSRSTSQKPHPPHYGNSLHPPSLHVAEQSGILQPLIIGDSSSESLLWSLPASLWTSTAVVRRVKAICQSVTKSSNILRAYDISSSTPEEDIVPHVLELVNDARCAWVTDCIAHNTKEERGGHGVWRYVFDQEGPHRSIPHHAADLMYLFDTCPLPDSITSPADQACPDMFFDGPFDVDDDESGPDSDFCFKDRDQDDMEWETVPVDEYSYTKVRDAMQSAWIAFACGNEPWRDDKVFVFGPEGETGERPTTLLNGRRRQNIWKSALEPLGYQLISKLGAELSRGPCS